MDREGFRNRLKQYKKAREENPGLKYYDFMERLAEFKAKEWDDDPDMVLTHMLNDNSYNYRQMYEDDPNYNIEEGHFVDAYKTVYHPTFSEESMYSGKKSQYNPEGIIGGSWDESTKSFYLNDPRQSKQKAQSYLNYADPGYRAIPTYDEGTTGAGEKNSIPTLEEYIAEQIAAKKAKALEKSLSRTTPRVPFGEKRGERWNPYTKKIENIYELGPSCAYTFSDNYGLNWMSSEDFRLNHEKYGFKQVSWKDRQPGNAVLIVDDNGVGTHTMMYDSDNAQGQPLFNHSNGGHDERAIRKKAKYPHHNDYLTYEFVGTPADSTQWINDYKKIYGFSEGTDGVMGPPTYEQWDTDTNRYTPTILDNASLYWSMEAAKKDLHNAAMKLPGYAERWAEYYRSLPKTDPDINEFVDELWENENPNNVGLKNGKYYPHKSPEGGAATIGPGFKLGSGSHKITKKQAERGMTKHRLDQEARRIGKQHLNAVDQFINYGQTTNPADTVSPQIKMGLMDLRHLVGPLNEWSSLREAVLNGDIEGIRKESTVTWNDNGKTKVDKRRKKIRDEKYFHYDEGGEVELDPLEVLERSRPKINGIPINDKPLSGTDPLGELYLNLVSGNAVRKAVMNGINGIVRKSFYNSYKDFLKAGWNRHKAYDYASPGIGINVLPGITKGFDYTIRGANYMHAAEKFIE